MANKEDLVKTSELQSNDLKIKPIFKDFKNCHATPLKAMRTFCLQCMGYQPSEVSRCTAPNCSLFPYRMKKKPKKGESTLISLLESIKITKG